MDIATLNYITPDRIKINTNLRVRKVLEISFLRKALQRLRNSAPRMDFYKFKHGDCENFDNGKCKAAHFTNLNPKETACPHYKPRQKSDADK